jgi:hypothetical protein
MRQSKYCSARAAAEHAAGAHRHLRWSAPRAALALALLALTPGAGRACATCGCTVNADAAMGFSAAAGWRLNIEYDYINQDELRSGTGSATPEQVVNNPSNPALGGGEIEHDTLNRYLNLSLSYRPDADWNFTVLVPYIMRDHSTFGQQQEPYTASESAPEQLSYGHISNLGDVKLLAAFQGLLPTHDLGVQLGVKLPTGQDGTHTDFESGPDRGTPVDASLQAGTGSTDLIIGSYYYQAVSANFDAFASAQFQAAVIAGLDKRGNDYRPGNSATFSIGLRYQANPRWIPQLQINVFHKEADQGALADTTDTAGTVAYFSPGLTVQALSRLHLYGVLQVPVYSNLNGYQLFPGWTATAGLSYAF